jgi:hypothetical protein
MYYEDYLKNELEVDDYTFTDSKTGLSGLDKVEVYLQKKVNTGIYLDRYNRKMMLKDPSIDWDNDCYKHEDKSTWIGVVLMDFDEFRYLLCKSKSIKDWYLKIGEICLRRIDEIDRHGRMKVEYPPNIHFI